MVSQTVGAVCENQNHVRVCVWRVQRATITPRHTSKVQWSLVQRGHGCFRGAGGRSGESWEALEGVCVCVFEAAQPSACRGDQPIRFGEDPVSAVMGLYVMGPCFTMRRRRRVPLGPATELPGSNMAALGLMAAVADEAPAPLVGQQQQQAESRQQAAELAQVDPTTTLGPRGSGGPHQGVKGAKVIQRDTAMSSSLVMLPLRVLVCCNAPGVATAGCVARRRHSTSKNSRCGIAAVMRAGGILVFEALQMRVRSGKKGIEGRRDCKQAFIETWK